MSWGQELEPIDHDIPYFFLNYRPDSDMYYVDYNDDDDPYVNQTLNGCKKQYKNRTEYLERHYPTGFCKVTFDSISCWPPTPLNQTATIKCFNELFSIKYDDTQNATRFCNANGNWSKQNYDVCLELVEIPEDNSIQTGIYFVGFTLSLITLIIAVAIFLYLDLRCLRYKIHVNLMLSYIIMYATWIVMLILINYQNESILLCGFGTTLLHYSHVSTFFWTFVEGMYLYILVMRSMRGEIFKLRVFISIGWGIPLILIVIWAVLKRFVTADSNCPWLYDDSIDWIYLAPPLLVVFLNLLFLFSIMRVLITKLRSSTSENQQHYKAAKALLVLIPLLGISWIITIYVPSTDVLQRIFESARTILLSTQGLTIALCYCFLNTEVQNSIQHHFNNWKIKRSLRSNSTKHCRDSTSGLHDNRHTEWTLVNADDMEDPNNTATIHEV